MLQLHLNMLVMNRYFLERSNSAKMTLKRARELFPVEVSAIVVHLIHDVCKAGLVLTSNHINDIIILC